MSKFGLKYESRGSMKSQCLVKFVIKLTSNTKLEFKWWKLCVDGSSNTKGSGAGVILESPNEVILEQS